MKKAWLFLFIIFSCGTLFAFDASDVAPIFVLPQADADNPIEEIFMDVTPENEGWKVETTVVFRDEDYPFFLFDWFYDFFRFFRWGRIKDIETFYIYLYQDGRIEKIDFPGTYSSDKVYGDIWNLHSSMIILGEEFEISNGRPLIYINTWNHMFSNEPSFHVSELIVSEYAIINGTREDGERKHSWIWKIR